MTKIICTLANASESISGVAFSIHERGMISEDISDAQVAVFLSIPGYEPETDSDAEAEAELNALREKAVALGIQVNNRWKAERLTAEIEKAEAKKTADEAEPNGDGDDADFNA